MRVLIRDFIYTNSCNEMFCTTVKSYPPQLKSNRLYSDHITIHFVELRQKLDMPNECHFRCK